MSDTLWTSDFSVRGRTVRVKKTGAVIPLDKALASEAANWFSLYLAIRAKTALNRLLPRGPAVWFAPDRPRPWYLIWAAAAWEGIGIARSPEEAAATTTDAPVTNAPAMSQAPAGALFATTTGGDSEGGSALDKHLGKMMGDAPFCDNCGHITVRNGACYRCLNCGSSMGCS